MWDDIVNNLSKFNSAILTGMDADGYPFSIRCMPEPDPSQKRFQIEILDEMPIEQGPANLMCHSHDEMLWDLKSFLVRGHLKKEEIGWVFYPHKFVTSGISSDPVEQTKGLFKGRKTAKKYLAKRGYPRPKVPWDDIKSLRAEAKSD